MDERRIGNQRLLVREQEPNEEKSNSRTTSTISTDRQTLANLTFLARQKNLSLRQYIRNHANHGIAKLTEDVRLENKLEPVGFGGVIRK